MIASNTERWVRSAGVALCISLVAMLTLCGSASARTLYQYHYDGVYPQGSFDGHDAVGTSTSTFGVEGLRQIAIDQSTGSVYVSNHVGSQGIYKFNAAGESEPFSALAPDTFISHSFGAPSSPADVAVDNTGTATQGRIYVIGKEPGGGGVHAYLPSGEEVKADFPINVEAVCAGAVAPDGNLWLEGWKNTGADPYISRVTEYTPNGDPTGTELLLPGANESCSITIDSHGNFFAGIKAFNPAVAKYDAFGIPMEDFNYENSFGVGRDVAVDNSTGDVFATRKEEFIGHISPAGQLFQTFGEPEGAPYNYPGKASLAFEGDAIAVNEQTGVVYAAFNGLSEDNVPSRVDMFAPSEPVVVPDVRAADATDITLVSATLRGVLNADSVGTTDCHFEYGLNRGYALGSVPCAEGNAFSDATDHDVSAPVAGLSIQTTYHYRLVVTNANRTIYGPDHTFTSAPYVKDIHTDPPTNVTLHSATLNGSFDPAGDDTHYYFQFGTSTSYGTNSATPPGLDAGDQSGSTPVSFDVDGLIPGTTYHYRIVAENSLGTSFGADQSFRATGRPTVGAWVSDVHSDSALVQVELTPNGEKTKFHLEYGTQDCALSVCTAGVEVQGGSGLGTETIGYLLSGLLPGTEYHFRVIAQNLRGGVEGGDHTFSTFSSPVPDNSCPNVLSRQQTGAALLLDCRAYELVSAADAGGYDVTSDIVPGQTPLEAHPDAKDLALYSLHEGAVPGIAGSPTNLGRDPYVASRGPTGWSTSYVGLPADGMADTGAFGSPLLGADSSLHEFAFGGEGICDPCFADGSTNIPLRLSDGTLEKGMTGTFAPAANPAGRVAAPFSRDGVHFVFGSMRLFEPAGLEGGLAIYDRNLATGKTQVVSTLPNGGTISGSEPAELGISADGSRIAIGERLATDAAGNDYYHLYMHLGGDPNSVDLTPATTHGVRFDGIDAGGGRVFFTTTDRLLGEDTDDSADIYQAEVDSGGALSLSLVSVGATGPSNDDSCSPPGTASSAAWNAVSPHAGGDCSALALAGGAGAAEEGGAFYFLSPEKLDGEEGIEDQPNLYVARPGSTPRFVATIDSSLAKPPKPAPTYPVANTKLVIGQSGAIGVAVDQAGSIYILNNATNVVRKYTAAGVAQKFTAGANSGTNSLTGVDAPTGAFSEEAAIPVQLAVDRANGYLYVPDYKHNVVDKFSVTGSYLGQLAVSQPTGVAVRPTGGDVYVASGAGGVQVFDASGAAVETLPLSASSIAVDRGGNLYGVQAGSVKAYDPVGGFVEELVSSGAQSVAVDATGAYPYDGDVYVDEGSSVATFDSERNPITTFSGEEFTASSGIAIGPNRHVYASRLGTRVYEFGFSDSPHPAIDSPPVLHALSQAGVHDYSDFQTSSDGRYAVLATRLRQGEYDSANHSEIYRYDVQTNRLDCTSCAPTNARASEDANLASWGLNVTDDGRVFFTSAEPLAARDLDGRKDVYEWDDGAIQLISAGTSPFDSSLLSVSSNGVDAFFFTRDTLAPQDFNGNTVKLYDAREDGGFFVSPPPFPCVASDECHGAGTTRPAPADIGTATGAGAGREAQPGCKKGLVKRHGKCVKPRHKKRHHKKRHHKKRHHKHRSGHGHG